MKRAKLEQLSFLTLMITIVLTLSFLIHFDLDLGSRSLSSVGRLFPWRFRLFGLFQGLSLLTFIPCLARTDFKKKIIVFRFTKFALFIGMITKIVSAIWLGEDDLSMRIHNDTAILFGVIAILALWLTLYWSWKTTKNKLALTLLIVYVLNSLIFLAFVNTLRFIATYQLFKLLVSQLIMVYLLFVNKRPTDSY